MESGSWRDLSTYLVNQSPSIPLKPLCTAKIASVADVTGLLTYPLRPRGTCGTAGMLTGRCIAATRCPDGVRHYNAARLSTSGTA